MGDGLPDTLIIDPLPHNRTYFQDHLQFLSNYYGAASKGAISFSATDIYPQTDEGAYRLDFPMWHYNYNTDDDLLDQRLVELFVQAVNLAEADVNFLNYDAILIFHAGVGKDFNIGYDETPFDIPSAFISEEDLQEFSGSLPSGVTKGLLLPECQNQREVLDYGIELSLNGVLVKLFGNWLGMPDLFNTEDGSSGIGRWGMMDQGSGNVNALVPSLPDIWSRIYMGWEEPVTIVPPGELDTVRVARFMKTSAPEAIKIPITPIEYYLIENRDADADSIQQVTVYDRDGRWLKVNHDGDMEIQEGFKVAVSADHYDFGIPGSGILIWHIDENVIDEQIEANRVNSDPAHRGVNLVEADGSQDIGQEYAFATAGSGTELGVQEDCWYRTNREHRDANGGTSVVRFNDRSRPSSKLYDKSFTNLELTNFSDVDSVMSFTIRSTNTITGFPLDLIINSQANSLWRSNYGRNLPDYAVADLDGDSINELCILTGDYLRIYDSTATLLWETPTSLLAKFADIGSQIDIDGDNRDELLLDGRIVGIVEFENDEFTLRMALSSTAPLSIRPARSISDEIRLVVFNSDYTAYDLLDSALNILHHDTLVSQVGNYQRVFNIESYPANSFLLVEDNNDTMHLSVLSVNDSSVSYSWQREIADAHAALPIKIVNDNNGRAIHISGYGAVEASTGNVILEQSEYVVPGVDWDGDGVADGARYTGAIHVEQEDAPHLTVDKEWIIDLDANGDPDIIGFTEEEGKDRYTRIKAAEHSGPGFSGFPIAAPGSPNREFFKWGSNDFLHYVSITEVDSINYLSIHRLPISSEGGERFPYTEPAAIINVGPLRPQVHNRSDWVYCWPNPTSDISHIRFTSSTVATASIQIFDIAGRRVKSLSGNSAQAGQFEVDWDVSNVQSGVYIAQAELESDGQTHRSEIKIAVVK